MEKLEAAQRAGKPYTFGEIQQGPAGWSEEGLGKLTKQRIYIKNRGKIEARDFKDKDRGKGSYGEYAERIIEEACEGAIDFSIFERREPVFDGAAEPRH